MKENYLSVTALTRYIKRKIDTDPHLSNIWLKGEISNFNHHSRGHMYLTIKDDQTRIQAVMFAGNNRRLKFTPENGMNVLIKGEISVFESFGQYQLYIQQMEPDGLGALYLAFEQLKEKLAKQGYFDEKYKKKIPKVPTHIGIITSPTGAAVRDIISTIKRRYPIVNSTVIPTLVQGPMAAKSIKEAIETANKSELFDVLILGRGGGSIEELWSFNEEIVAEAIFKSKIPIISAVGHETDTTISDFVADLRAPTPTGAAEIAVPSQKQLFENVTNLTRYITRAIRVMIETNQQQLNRINQSYAFRYPVNLIKQKEQELDKNTQRLERSFTQLTQKKQESYIHIKARLFQQHPEEQLNRATTEINQLIKRKNMFMSQIMDHKIRQLSIAVEKLTLLNPLEIMKRGFAIPYTMQTEIIKSINQINIQDRMIIKLSDGEIDCEVMNVKENNNG